MKVLALVFLLIVSVSVKDCKAQKNLDSLRGVRENPQMSDSALVGAIADYIYAGYLFGNRDSAAILGNELMRFSEKTGNLFPATCHLP